MQGSARIRLIMILIVANIAADQVTKVLARKHIEYNERIEIIGDYLIFTKVENTGAFLGMGSELSPTLRILTLLVLPTLVMLGILYYLIRTKDLTKYSIWGLSFIVGGGLGNIYDRMVYGSVTDMLFLDFQFAHTGIFNVADMSVMIGTGLVLLEHFLHKKKEAPEQS
jgi:signal peptidase II